MTRLVQLTHADEGRAVALVEGEALRLLDGFRSAYALTLHALRAGTSLAAAARDAASSRTLPYDDVYRGRSAWRLLPAFDHSEEPARCLVTGTGLTHKASAANRQAMHAAGAAPTDSMRMYQWGLEGGRPAEGAIGVAPEWFYKGCGTILRAHGEPLVVPTFGEDGGEEPELAGAYIIDDSGAPRRAGFVMANEFSDHVLEKRSYLYLQHSKLRTCAIGPELVLDLDFTDLRGQVSVERGGAIVWSSPIASGEVNMSHSLSNLEHHHFKYEAHRRPGDAHIHFFGADAFSFGSGLLLEQGDVMIVEFAGLGRPLRNPIHFDRGTQRPIRVRPL